MQNHLLICYKIPKSTYCNIFQVVADNFLSATKFNLSATKIVC